ncbi:hypothetical protein KKE92_04115 [Candidatus Micrarchaeota archaeon]|nr:hypothetical protein [Candidatus Micrarchaeota archaeon]MBU1681402.1 hypothetical protein [Candidatus Micrarchaeota archaeon]
MPVNMQQIVISPSEIGSHIGKENLPGKWAYIGTNQSQLLELEKKLGESEKIDIREKMARIAKNSRQKYIDYIGKLRVPEDKSLWLASRLSEKNPFLSNAFLHICQARLCEEIINEHTDIVLIIENKNVRTIASKKTNQKSKPLLERNIEKIKCWLSEGFLLIKKRSFFLAKYIFRYFIVHFFIKSKKKDIEKQSAIFIHTFLNPKSFSKDGRYKDAYFGELKNFLEKKRKRVTYMSQIPNIRDYYKLSKKIGKSSEMMIVPDNYIGFFDIWSVFFRSLQRIKFDKMPEFYGVGIKGIIDEDLKKEWLEGWSCVSLLYEPIFRNMKKDGVKIERMIYTFEGTSWEKILCHSLKRYFPETKIIGYQHAAVSSMQLNHFLSEEEMKITELPDRIITSGEYMHDSFVRSGYPAEKIVKGGTIRFAYLYDKKIKESMPSNNILVTTSINKIEAVELIRKTILALGEKTGYNVIVKCHPHMRYSILKKEIQLELPQNFEISEKPVAELFETSDFLLYTDSTTALEALFLGIFPIHMESELGLDMDKLDFDPEIRKSFVSSEDLTQELENMRKMKLEEIQEIRRRKRKKIEKLLGEVTEETYSLFLD